MRGGGEIYIGQKAHGRRSDTLTKNEANWLVPCVLTFNNGCSRDPPLIPLSFFLNKQKIIVKKLKIILHNPSARADEAME